MPETRVLHQGRTGHSTGAVLSSLAPFPHSSASSLPWAGLAVPCPFPEQRQPQHGAKCCQAAPQAGPPLSHVTVPSMEGHHKQSSESPHGDRVLSRGGSACTKPSPTPQAGPCSSPADVQAWHLPVTLQPPLFCQATGTLPWAPASHRPRAVGGNSPTDSTGGKPCSSPCHHPCWLHVPGAAA